MFAEFKCCSRKGRGRLVFDEILCLKLFLDLLFARAVEFFDRQEDGHRVLVEE